MAIVLRPAGSPRDIFREEESRLDDFSVIYNVDLRPYHKDHSMVLASYP